MAQCFGPRLIECDIGIILWLRTLAMRASEIFRDCRTIPRYLLYPPRCSLGTAVMRHSGAAGIDHSFRPDITNILVKRPCVVNSRTQSLLRAARRSGLWTCTCRRQVKRLPQRGVFKAVATASEKFNRNYDS
jgi:hypothetical protein